MNLTISKNDVLLEDDYNLKAEKFLRWTDTTFDIQFIKHDYYFHDDEKKGIGKRDIYEFTFKRENREYKGTFGNSVISSGQYWKVHISQEFKPKFKMKVEEKSNSEKLKYTGDTYIWLYNDNFHIPTAYDVIASLEKYDVGTFEDFCSCFGYDEDPRSAEKTYNAVKKQVLKVQSLWTDEELEVMQEIQ